MKILPLIILTLLILTGCKKEEPEIITDDPIVGHWRYSGTIAQIDEQPVSAGKYSEVLYITDSTIRIVTQVKGKLVDDPLTQVSRNTDCLCNYERLIHGVICTIDNFEQDSIVMPEMKGMKKYFVLDFITLDKMQFVEADECIRLSGNQDSVGNSSFYHLDSVRLSAGQYSYVHYKYEFSGSLYNEFTFSSLSKEMPGNESYTLGVTGQLIFNKELYIINQDGNKIKVPYFFAGGRLYQKKLDNKYFDNYSWIAP